MSDPQQLERDLREYIEKEPNMRRDDRLAYLKLILHRHLEMTKLEHVVNANDVFDIVSYAKSGYAKATLPMRVSKKQLDSSEAPHVSMIESVIAYLNRMNLLKKAVKMDYTA